MPPVKNRKRLHQAVRVILGNLHGADDRRRFRSLYETPDVLVARPVDGVEPSAIVKNQFGDVLRSEVGSKGAAKVVWIERFSKKDSTYQHWNMPENNF